MRVPATLDLYAWQNAGFDTDIAVLEDGAPYDLTGLATTDVTLQVRSQPGGTGTPFVDAEIGNGLAITDPTSGVVRFVITEATLTAIPVTTSPAPLTLYWDMRIDPVTGVPFIAAQGKFFLSAGVTR